MAKYDPKNLLHRTTEIIIIILTEVFYSYLKYQERKCWDWHKITGLVGKETLASSYLTETSVTADKLYVLWPKQ